MILESVLLLIIFLSFSYIGYVLWFQNYSHLFSLLHQIPGPPGHPIIGNLLAFHASTTAKLFQLDRKLLRDYYPLYKEWTLTYGAVNLVHPDDVQLILSSNNHIDKGVHYNFLQSWLGTGLLTSGGTKWQTRRKILTPAFHFSILQEFVPIFNEETQKMVQVLKNMCNEAPIDVVPPVTQFTLLSITETSMGVKLDTFHENSDSYKKAIHTFGYALTYRMLRPWLYNDTVFFNFTRLGRLTSKSIKVLHNFSRNVIAEKRNTFAQSHRPSKMAMLDLLLTAQSQGADIDDDGIAEEVDTFMFEGHDTTSLAICYTLLLLANYPTIQEEIFEEMKAVLGHPIKTPTYNDLKELTFMERCIKESLRLFPSVPFISRLLAEDVTTATGYVIPKGAMAHIHIYDLHRNPETYREPEKFDPDRFLPENTKNRHPFAYLPFSAGPRNCIGQKFAILELKAVLCGVLDAFVLERGDKVEDLTMITDLVLRCQKGIRVKFRPRVTA